MSTSSDLKSLLPENEPESRREFVVKKLAVGFALAVQPICAQTAIITDATGLIAGEVKIPVKDGVIPGYRACPAKGRGFPIVLVVQEIFGVHEHIKDICRRLAHAGYCAVAPELFARAGRRFEDDRRSGDCHQGGLQGARRAGDERSGCDRELGGEDLARRHRQDRDHGLLLGRTDRVAVRVAQSQTESGRGLVWTAGRATRPN